MMNLLRRLFCCPEEKYQEFNEDGPINKSRRGRLYLVRRRFRHESPVVILQFVDNGNTATDEILAFSCITTQKSLLPVFNKLINVYGPPNVHGGWRVKNVKEIEEVFQSAI